MSTAKKVQCNESAARKAHEAIVQAEGAVTAMDKGIAVLRGKLAADAAADESGATSPDTGELLKMQAERDVLVEGVKIAEDTWRKKLANVRAARLEYANAELEACRVERPLAQKKIEQLETELADARDKLEKNKTDSVRLAQEVADHEALEAQAVRYIQGDTEELAAMLDDPLGPDMPREKLRPMIAEWRKGRPCEKRPGLREFPAIIYLFTDNKGQLVDDVVRRWQTKDGRVIPNGAMGNFSPEAHRKALERDLFGVGA